MNFYAFAVHFYRAVFLFVIMVLPAFAEEIAPVCVIHDQSCVIEKLITSAEKIDNVAWRDQTYREIAKSLAANNQIDKAIGFIEKIQTPDTKALTIRGIGMAAAENDLPRSALDNLFIKLLVESKKIEHAPSHAIALTYVAMAQAFAGDDEGAWKTAAMMSNDALRNKAYGETAEIQAEAGKFSEAVKSIGFINTASYQDKSYGIVSKLLADGGKLQEAYEAAVSVKNDYKRASALQYVLDVQNTLARKKKLEAKAEADRTAVEETP